jgi:uncharacterized protein YndB with AHSA1/START domain
MEDVVSGVEWAVERIEREEVLDAPTEEVWESLTDEDRLEEWLGEEVELDPVEGGEIAVRDDEGERTGVVETVIEQERLIYTWSRPGEAPSRVDFAIEAVPAGTRLTVIETTLGGPTALAAGFWAPRLRALQLGLVLVSA